MKKRDFWHKCIYCNRDIFLSSDMIITHQVENEENGEILKGTFFQCPACGNLELQFIDNERSLGIKSPLIQLEEKILKSQSHGKAIHKKQMEKYHMLTRELNRVRNKLTCENQECFISFIEKTETE